MSNLTVVPDFDMNASRITTPMGLPPDPWSNLVPGLESTVYAQTPDYKITSVQGVWDSITNFSESTVRQTETLARDVYGGLKDITKTVYGDARSAVGTVIDDVTEPLGSTVKNLYWYMILGLIVVGGVVYFAGKSGAINAKVSV